MIKAKIQIGTADIQEAMQELYSFKICPIKISKGGWSYTISFWIKVANDEELITVLTTLNRRCSYGGAVLLKKKKVKTKVF